MSFRVTMEILNHLKPVCICPTEFCDLDHGAPNFLEGCQF